MPNAKRIVFTFASFRKTAKPIVFTVGDEIITAPGSNLMTISLVANIPYQLIVGSIKNIM